MSPVTHLLWFALGAGVGFVISYTFGSLLGLQHDLYYLVYFALTGIFLGAYVAETGIDVGAVFRRSLPISLALGVVTAAVAVMGVFQQADATPRPGGAYLVFEVLWRGVTYGAVDALLLTTFPALVAYGVLRGNIATAARRAGFAALTLALALVITATYHLGYEQYREDGIAGPETGNVIYSVPTLITANPIGSVIAHGAMHVAAVIHAYETDLYLPPRTEVP